MEYEIVAMDCEERGSFWLGLESDHGIFFAATGGEGLEMLSGNIGLVFLNLTLPDIDGLDMLGMITEKYPSTAVVIIAPCGTEEPCMCMEAFRRGAWDYIRKPLKTEDVLAKIDTYMPGDNWLRETRRTSSFNAVQEQYPDIPSHLVNGVLKVRDFIAQNYADSLNLEAACKMAATSKTYFCRFFKQVTGHSLRGYYNVIRVRAAERLLKDRRLSVTDVAVKLGYHDSNYFSTIYKKMTGAPPKFHRAPVDGPCRIR